MEGEETATCAAVDSEEERDISEGPWTSEVETTVTVWRGFS